MRAATLCALLTLGWSTVAQAQPTEAVEAVVFEVEGAGVASDLLTNLSAVLRNEALQHPGYALVNATPLQRAETAVVLGCEPDTTACLEQMAAFAGAQVLIFGDVRRRGDSLVVSVSIFDRLSATEPLQVERSLSSTDPVLGFRREVAGVFAELATADETMLEVSAPGADDTIRIDGVMVGRGRLTRQGLPPGSYRVEVDRAGARPYVEEVQLRAGEPVVIEVPAARAGKQRVSVAPSEEVRSEEVRSERDGAASSEVRSERAVSSLAPPIAPRRRSRLGAYSSLGVGVVALGGAGAMVFLMRGIEEDIATENSAGTMTPARYNELLSRGQSFETAQWVLLGVGAGATALGLGWLIVSGAQDKPGLAIGVGPGSVSVRARF